MSETSTPNDVSWILNELKNIQQGLKLMYDHQHTTLTFDKYSFISTTLNHAYTILENMQHNEVILVKNEELGPRTSDLVSNSLTPIFLFYWTLTDGTTFKDYFHKNLNPDIAPCGFLEQLDELISISRKRPLVLSYSNEQEKSYCDTIKEYIESC